MAAGERLGLVNVGGVPVMEWSGKPRPVLADKFTARKATKDDVRAAYEVAARAFSIENEKVQRVTEAGYPLYEKVGFEVVATPPVLLIGESTQFPG